MKRQQKVVILLGMVFVVFNLWLTTAKAQEQAEWSPPFRLSSGQGKASEATLVNDQYGYVHAFWSETREGDRSVIQYARFDGSNWTVPNDIYITPAFGSIGNISSAIDGGEILYVAWTHGQSGGPAFIMSAPIHDGLSAQKWQQRHRIDIQSDTIRLQIDSKGVFHLLYTREFVGEAGVYYVRSEDQGLNWTQPVWLDPDILPNHSPGWPQFVLDEADGLHATWYYIAFDISGGDWVRYTHSLDGGNTWSLPFTIDKLGEDAEENDEKLSAANPNIIVQDQTVHVIWAGGKLHYRHHRFSEDRGQTWSTPTQLFDTLNGQAGDGLAVDGAGRVHFFSQIRFPQGVWHAVWDEGRWSEPSLIYLISRGSSDPMGDRIHAHRTFPVIRAGNQLLLTLTDPPPEAKRRLFVMQRPLDDVPPSTVMSTSTPTATPIPEPEATPLPLATVPAPFMDDGSMSPLANIPRPDSALWVGLIPALLLLGGMLLFQFLFRLRR